MKTLEMLSMKPEVIPAMTAWYISDLSEARGRQELFTRQSPQRLKVLRDHAIIESAISSNRLEGVEIDKKRINDVILKNSRVKDRSEEEVRGYRDSLRLIHTHYKKLRVDETLIKKLHKINRGEIWDAGSYKEKNVDIIEKKADGSRQIRFMTVKPGETPAYMRKLTGMWQRSIEEKWVHPLIALAAFNLDFLCIHPFRDGNGRVSRLLLLLQFYQCGYAAGRFVSLENIIEQNKDRYYETLKQSSQGWHRGKHDPWIYINYLLFILKTAYKEFEESLGRIKSPRGAKTQQVKRAVKNFSAEFTLSELERSCPGVSRDMIRIVLKEMKKERKIKCLGRGPGAKWAKKGNTLKRG
ncbi:MAG: Fic family protein [Elusimicrobia bacterium]|nr:Fic family protein [Elusimicrobiota bacterium]